MRLISKHTHTRIFSSNCKKYTKCDYKVNLLGLHRRDSDVCVVCKLVNQIINILPRLQLDQQQQTEIETCQTIQLQLCNKRLEQDREREREKNKQNDMKSNEIGTIPIEHTTCGLLLLFWSESDQKEQRVVLPDVVSLVHQMPNALQDIKILYDRHFALFLPSSLHCFFFLSGSLIMALIDQFFPRQEMCEMFSSFVIGLQQQSNEDICLC